MIKKEPSLINYKRLIAAVFGLMSLGGIGETKRILTSNAPDIVAHRSSLIPIVFVMTTLFIILTVYFWRKGRNN